MASRVLIEERVEIPLGIATLDEFRGWASSVEFPEHGRVDYVQGRIEVAMSPEDLFSHGSPKIEIVRVLSQQVKDGDLGFLFADRARTSSPAADLSAEPDVVFVSHAAVEQARVRLVPTRSGERDRYVELEGAPDLIVEIVSDGSVDKDTRRLPAAYFEAGVEEFWLVDARGAALLFRVHRRGPVGFEPVASDAEDFQASVVLGRRYRLDRQRTARGFWSYELNQRP